jgi:hypothetical protein
MLCIGVQPLPVASLDGPTINDVMVAESAATAPGKTLWDVQQFVDQRLNLLVGGKAIVMLGDQFDHIVGPERHGCLENTRQGVTTGQRPATLRAVAAHTPHARQIDVIETQRRDQFAHLRLDVWGLFIPHHETGERVIADVGADRGGHCEDNRRNIQSFTGHHGTTNTTALSSDSARAGKG